jgi:hypothetical protein
VLADSPFQSSLAPAKLTAGFSPQISPDACFAVDHVSIMTQTQTTLDKHFVKTRQRPIRGVGLGKGFSVLLEGAAGKDASKLHQIEHIGYIALQEGVGSLGKDIYQAATTPDKVTNKPYGRSLHCVVFHSRVVR